MMEPKMKKVNRARLNLQLVQQAKEALDELLEDDFSADPTLTDDQFYYAETALKAVEDVIRLFEGKPRVRYYLKAADKVITEMRSHVKTLYGNDAKHEPTVESCFNWPKDSKPVTIRASFHTLYELFGAPTKDDAFDKSTSLWCLDFNGRIVTVYDNKQDYLLTNGRYRYPPESKPYDWHVGGPATVDGFQIVTDFVKTVESVWTAIEKVSQSEAMKNEEDEEGKGSGSD